MEIDLGKTVTKNPALRTTLFMRWERVLSRSLQINAPSPFRVPDETLAARAPVGVDRHCGQTSRLPIHTQQQSTLRALPVFEEAVAHFGRESDDTKVIPVR